MRRVGLNLREAGKNSTTKQRIKGAISGGSKHNQAADQSKNKQRINAETSSGSKEK
jgi:hypothetical protein